MLTITVGYVIAVVLLLGFGFISTASNRWFFHYRNPQDTFPSPGKNI